MPRESHSSNHFLGRRYHTLTRNAAKEGTNGWSGQPWMTINDRRQNSHTCILLLHQCFVCIKICTQMFTCLAPVCGSPAMHKWLCQGKHIKQYTWNSSMKIQKARPQNLCSVKKKKTQSERRRQRHFSPNEGGKLTTCVKVPPKLSNVLNNDVYTPTSACFQTIVLA